MHAFMHTYIHTYMHTYILIYITRVDYNYYPGLTMSTNVAWNYLSDWG